MAEIIVVKKIRQNILRRILTSVFALLFVAGVSGIFYPAGVAQGNNSRATQPPQQGTSGGAARQQTGAGQSAAGEKKLVYIKGDVSRNLKFNNGSGLYFLGNVIVYHNGAVITCDSAVRYSDRHVECFKRVIINQGTTFVYGDRAEYNGDNNLARVYAPIIKVVDEDATLYTYNLEFNTLDKVCVFSGGGTMSQQDNLLEANRGYYYVDAREMVGVDNVELSNPDYKLISDSVGYNLDSKIATMFTKTYIWNNKGEILSAERGQYLQNTAEYKFTKNAYIITAAQEIWADTLDYNSNSEDALARSNVQLRDEDQQVMAFGDYAEYWGGLKNALLTKEPSLVTFDPEEDTLYMRSDSMFLYTLNKKFEFKGRITPSTILEERTARPEAEETPDFGGGRQPSDEEITRRMDSQSHTYVDSASMQPTLDSIAETGVADTLALETALTKAEIKAQRAAEKKRIAEERRKALEEKRRAAAEVKKAKAEAKAAARRMRQEAKNAEKEARRIARGKGSVVDTLLVDSLMLDSVALDSLLMDSLLFDSLTMGLDSLALAEIAADSVGDPADTLQRVVLAYFNVRMYRNDFQAVCDSLIGFSLDSTLHMYIDPVLWSESNQIVSEVVDVYTKNEQLYKAVFSGGSPIMSSEVDTTRYNQVQGKTIEAFFRDNDIYKADVVGNAQTLYYMQDEKTGELNGFMTLECADMTFHINNKQMEDIVGRGNPVYAMYPMDKIPDKVDQRLKGFVWKGDLKPRREDVFTRYIRPSERDRHEAMPQPQFPLTDRINKDREEKVKRRIWVERNDRLSQEAEDFIREITTR